MLDRDFGSSLPQFQCVFIPVSVKVLPEFDENFVDKIVEILNEIKAEIILASTNNYRSIKFLSPKKYLTP